MLPPCELPLHCCTAAILQALAGRENGDVIIRPSSKGPTHLSVTMRFHDGIFTHFDIAESGKDRTSAASFLRLGKTLKIGDDTFEDLDEVRECS